MDRRVRPGDLLGARWAAMRRAVLMIRHVAICAGTMRSMRRKCVTGQRWAARRASRGDLLPGRWAAMRRAAHMIRRGVICAGIMRSMRRKCATGQRWAARRV